MITRRLLLLSLLQSGVALRTGIKRAAVVEGLRARSKAAGWPFGFGGGGGGEETTTAKPKEDVEKAEEAPRGWFGGALSTKMPAEEPAAKPAVKMTTAVNVNNNGVFGAVGYAKENFMGTCASPSCASSISRYNYNLVSGATIATAAYQKKRPVPKSALAGLPVHPPARYGMSLEKLRAVDEAMRQATPRYCMAVVMNGSLVYASGNNQRKNIAMSMTKTLTGILVGMAVKDGLDINAFITAKYGVTSPRPYDVTTAMIMSQAISGTSAGDKFKYDAFGHKRLDVLIDVVKKATGKSMKDYYTQLAKAMGLTIIYDGKDTAHSAQGTCIDFAKLGKLLLQRGKWGKEQILTRKYVEELAQPHAYGGHDRSSNPCYGFMTWIVRKDVQQCPMYSDFLSAIPASPDHHTAFAGIGSLGQIMLVLPKSNMVVVSMGSTYMSSLAMKSYSLTSVTLYMGGTHAFSVMYDAMEENDFFK